VRPAIPGVAHRVLDAAAALRDMGRTKFAILPASYGRACLFDECHVRCEDEAECRYVPFSPPALAPECYSQTLTVLILASSRLPPHAVPFDLHRRPRAVLSPQQVAATLDLFGEGNTFPSCPLP
jgi:hypothetical protein